MVDLFLKELFEKVVFEKKTADDKKEGRIFFKNQQTTKKHAEFSKQVVLLKNQQTAKKHVILPSTKNSFIIT